MECPDTDGDGVGDCSDAACCATTCSSYACPAGQNLNEMSDCPDTDGDGVGDCSDAECCTVSCSSYTCPAGQTTREWMECPDTDRDGVAATVALAEHALAEGSLLARVGRRCGFLWLAHDGLSPLGGAIRR